MQAYLMYFKLGAVALIVAAATFFMHRHDVRNFNDYKTEQAMLVQKSQLEAKQKEAAQNETTYQAAQVYSGRITHLESQLAWMRKHPANGGADVRSPAASPEGADATSPEFGRTCTRQFYEDGLRDAQQLNELIATLGKLGIQSK